MIPASSFVQAAAERGFRFYTGVPCSYLTPFINFVINSDQLRYVGATNEGDAVAIAAGAELGGQPSVVLLQNSGLGNAVNPLTSLTYTFQIPMLLIATLRGEPGTEHHEPQHHFMGQITTSLLDLLQITWEYFPVEAAAVPAVLDRAVSHMRQNRLPYALVMKKDSVEPRELDSGSTNRPLHPPAQLPPPAEPLCTRGELLRAIQASTRPTDAVAATTGFICRELYACGDRENQFYMVGSMGCVSSFGLGLALTQPQRRVIVIDGDGALLMRMGALATIGFERPANLIQIVLDNQIHESTGGQATVSGSLDFCEIARSCGYPRVVRVVTPAEMSAELARESEPGPCFMHAKILPGAPDDLPRPAVTPPEIASRFRRFLAPPFPP